MNTVGFDIGGTQCRAAVVDAAGHVLDRRAVPTPGTVHELDDTIAGMLADLCTTHDIDAVGLAVAGFLDSEREIVRFAPHLPWRDAPVRRDLSQRLGLPVVLEHDANSAAWGEYRFGSARDADTWVFFAVGTGIGAALMINGQLFRGAHGTAPEFGHLTVVPGGRVCSCGKAGCLERYASGTALADTAFENGLPAGLSGQAIMSLARSGDERARAVLDDFARWLGQGLAMVTDVLDPELIVLGGGVVADADLFLPAACATLGQRVVGAGHRPLPVVGTAKLGADAGMIGVADLARTETQGE
ncbi:MAG: ROK family protein [Corynebacterium sp.]|uniref:ROK family protein n=1 Tax=Corynebacterium sp. TaxID=1720 RepID=UPI0026E0853D|nr:ROK family protein [Corynebacterium sp.]MDO5668803.1 ROK family protein [Corynebacterium sp.]